MKIRGQKLPLNRELVIRSAAPRILNPHDGRKVVFTRWLLLDEDLAATALLSQSYGDASIGQGVTEVWLPVVIGGAADGFDISRAAANSDSHVVVNAATPGHAPAAVGIGILTAAATATPTTVIELACDVG